MEPAHDVTGSEVLVVGGSLVGSSAAMFLASRGVRTVLVEKHASSSLHPRAMGFTTRTMELYRAAGLGTKVPQVPPGFSGPRRISVESLAGKWATEEVAWSPQKSRAHESEKPPVSPEYSICTGAAIAQDRLEPILRERAIELGADIRMSTTLIAFDQDTQGVRAVLRSGEGRHYTFTADYLIAADGASSQIRDSLGIGRHGNGALRTVRSVLFRSPLEHYLESGISQFEIEQPGFRAMLTTYRDGRWLLIFEDREDCDEAALRALIEKSIGRSDLPVEIITTGRWELTALIADRFSSGRIFLAGDSAHTLPPARGGYGANTGIEDAHNLAWKLASVLSGVSGHELLDTYDAERRPIAWLRHAQIFARPDYQRFASPADREVPVIDNHAMELGQRYSSSAVIDSAERIDLAEVIDKDMPLALRPDQWAGQPGTRAPHVWVLIEGVKTSTLDLMQPDWVLITEDERWLAPSQTASESLKIKLKCVTVAGAAETTPASCGPDDPAAFQKAFGIGSTGASLVRPDGYIAWRSPDMPLNAADILIAVLRQAASVRQHKIARVAFGS